MLFLSSNSLLMCRLSLCNIWVTGSAEARKTALYNQNVIQLYIAYFIVNNGVLYSLIKKKVN
jgi:hypothetical protein